MSKSKHFTLVAEMRRTAKTLSVDCSENSIVHRRAGELMYRAAEALALSYTPAQMAASFRAGLTTAYMQEKEANAPAAERSTLGADADEDAGTLDTEELLVMAAQAQRQAVGHSSLIAARIDQMVADVRSGHGAEEQSDGS
ncbi:TPA: hypothetical protein R4K21_003063 [Stenotrophomonas maltophilia]|nr:hypothetical protein [Stenotrophomonas maltophilia]